MPRSWKPRPGALDIGLWTVGILLFLSGPALAFGPAAHIEFGLNALRYLALLPAGIRTLLRHYPDQFLYGTCAADIIVGKNMAEYVNHCHNWDVGFRMLDHADSGRVESLCWGFLCHLAADVVAHNYFVPLKTITSYRAQTTRHIYWEMRFDQARHNGDGVWEALDFVGRSTFLDEDAFLRRELSRSSRLLPFEVSRRLFNSVMMVQRTERWRQTVSNMADRSAWALAADEISFVRSMALDSTLSLLSHGRKAPVVQADPTGMEVLAEAKKLRGALKRRMRQGAIDDTLCTSGQKMVRVRLEERLTSQQGHLPAVVDLEAACGDEMEAPAKKRRFRSKAKRLTSETGGHGPARIVGADTDRGEKRRHKRRKTRFGKKRGGDSETSPK
ncbi:MAG: zinc dependent phospholipase C family protein [Deltaproteobacteria bacterium]|nr:zinc dependent phospholipase C family protein [Deltaproteobacteria bacterium]